MIDGTKISKGSNLIDEALAQQLQAVFSKLETPVTIRAVVDLDRDKDAELAEFLNTIVSLEDKLTLALYTPEEAAAEVPELDITYLPVTGLYQGGSFGRVSFHGIPAGKEMNSFVLAIYNLSGPGTPLDSKLEQAIRALSKTARIKVCVSLACHHCPAVVAACQQIAILNPLIEAEMIDAALFPALVAQYKIERVPMIIVNDTDIYMGNKTMDQLVELLKN